MQEQCHHFLMQSARLEYTGIRNIHTVPACKASLTIVLLSSHVRNLKLQGGMQMC